MATVVLQTVGAVVGTALGGPIGGAIGQTLGALGGAQIDQKLFGPGDQKRFGPRLDSTRTLTSQEGNAVARVFGRAKIAGEIIWATRFEEVAKTQTQKQGGKGSSGPKTTTTSYSYFGNFAVALCEGEISRIGRIWIDGKIIDKSSIDFRAHLGSKTQLPDPLIEAKQGTGNAPAYRGLAYVVFERLPLADYGNRIPQVAIEVMTTTNEVGAGITGINIIPGATEFGYDSQEAKETLSRVETRSLNVHQMEGVTDFVASLDDLQAHCPNLRQVALVVAWFGSDLRAGNCVIEPKVEVAERTLTSGISWSVDGVSRAEAPVVSAVEGELSFGGTPSDNSVLRAIAEIKARGLRVCLNPFLMMDIPPLNDFPNPFGGSGQPAYPWRGRITCSPAIGEADTVDGSSEAGAQIAQFFNGRTAGENKNYHRFIMHYARLAQQAGGVDMFLIGSEMRGLTSVRNDEDLFPFVDALTDLASDVKPLVGDDCIVTYGADWSEYFGYQIPGTNGDIVYNLDSLWASPDIGAVGIDNYFPISDWRENQDNSGEGTHAGDIEMFRRNIAGGEGYHWYYQNQEDRENRIRTEITDGLGKPWIYRNKDLISWWSNEHFNRVNGIESSDASAWQPQMKPIIFTEYGAPAVHNGAAQPNVFYDPKSSENALPYFSNGGRDDEAQLNYHRAMQQHWAGQGTDQNPLSSVYGGAMVDFELSQAWTWDARPYPQFPQLETVWGDSENWYRGHWLTGRLGRLKIADLIRQLIEPYEIFEIDVSRVVGTVDGYVIAEVTSARGALEALLSLYSITIYEDAGRLVFSSLGKDDPVELSLDDLTLEEGEPLTAISKSQQSDLPQSVSLSFISSNLEYGASTLEAQRINGSSIRQTSLTIPLVSSANQLEPVLERWLNGQWVSQETSQLTLSKSQMALTLGDKIILPGSSFHRPWRITAIEEGKARRLTATAVDPTGDLVGLADDDAPGGNSPITYSKPLVWFLDLPILPGQEDSETNRIAVSAVPWQRSFDVFSSPSSSGFVFRQSLTQQATTGRVINGVPPGEVHGRWHYSDQLEIELDYGQLSTVQDIDLFRGVNAAAVRSTTGQFEVFQFAEAELIAPLTWRLSKLLRGQLGTEVEARAGAPEGADIIFLDEAVEPLSGVSTSRGLPLNWKIGPGNTALTDELFADLSFTPGYRGQQPYSPVHLRAVQSQLGLDLTWTRRNRINADDWSPPEIPISEESLQFSVRVLPSVGPGITHLTSAEALTIPEAELATAFGTGTHYVSILVSQVSAATGEGPATQISYQLNL